MAVFVVKLDYVCGNSLVFKCMFAQDDTCSYYDHKTNKIRIIIHFAMLSVKLPVCSS